jgi:hypothetical protein
MSAAPLRPDECESPLSRAGEEQLTWRKIMRSKPSQHNRLGKIAHCTHGSCE